MSGLDRLVKYRDALLLTEVAVWLHLTGKFSSQFFKDQLAGKGKAYKEFYKELDYAFKDLYNGTSWPEKHWQITFLSSVQWAQSFAQFSKQHDNQGFAEGRSPVTLAADAHGRGSGTDKSVQADQIYSQQCLGDQDLRDCSIRLATTFGYERDIDNDELDRRRNELYQFITDGLGQIKEQIIGEEEIDWAESLCEFVDRLQNDFSTTVGDTRRPINDVSLWDQTAATVAFFKPALAKNVILEKWINPLESKYKWRFLSIALDGLNFWGAANRVGDLRARQRLITEALDDVKKLLEITYPLAVEVYRDETGSLFLCSDEPDEPLKLIVDGLSLEQHIQAKVLEATQGEITVKIDLDPQATRNVLRAGYWLIQPLPPVSADPMKLEEWWRESKGHLLCGICALRPQGYGGTNHQEITKALEREICCVCMNRMGNQASKWVKKELNRTIWIDEVSDINARAALIVGQFDLEHWLDGIYVSSTTIPDPSDVDQQGHSFHELLEEVKDGLVQSKDSGRDFQEYPIINGLLDDHVAKDLGSFEKLDEFLVQQEDLAQSAGDIEPHKRLALALIRKPPSFARLRRVWETTRRFWQEVMPTDEIADLAGSLAAQKIGQAGLRLKIKGQLHPQQPGDTPGPFHAYELVLEPGVKLSVVWDADRQRFITADNLTYLGGEGQLGQLVLDWLQAQQGKKLRLEEPSGYSSANKVWGEIEVENVKPIANSTYTPAIPILAEPRTFMALIPADKAMDIARAIKEKYEREMGKVRNRLPLHLGLVFFHRRTPLRAALEAGRGILSMAQPDEMQVWQLIEDAQVQDGNCTLHFFNNGVEWTIPILMGDEKTEDKWYPYFFIKEPGENSPKPKDRGLAFEGMRPIGHDKTESCWLVHAKKLCAGDQVWITPSTFDYEYLDTTARRFEVSYNGGQRRVAGKRHRPYLLEELEQLEEVWEKIKPPQLSQSQIKALISLIETKRGEWNKPTGSEARKLSDADPFRWLCRNALATTNWRDKWKDFSVEDKNMLEDAAVSGMLTDVVELHLTIAKEGDREED